MTMVDIEASILGLHSPHEKTRAKSALRLSGSGNEAVIEPLIAAFKDPSSKVRRQVIFALRDFNDPRVTALLVVALHDPIMDVQHEAFAALRRKGVKVVEELATAFHKEADGYIRASLLSILGRINDIRSRVLFITALGDSEKDVREVALAIQKQVSDPNALTSVIALLDDPYLCGRAISILGNLGDSRAIEPLEKFVSDLSRSGSWGDYCRKLARKAISYIQQGGHGSFPLWE